MAAPLARRGSPQAAGHTDVTTVFQLSQEHVSGSAGAFGLGPASFYHAKQQHSSIGRQPPQPHGYGHQNAYTPAPPPLPYDAAESHYATLQLEHMEDEYQCCAAAAAIDAPAAAPELPARNGAGGQRGALSRLGHH